MVGIFSSFMVAGLLMAGPAGFTFDGPEVTARTVGNVGYFTQGATPYADLFERGRGTAVFSARERITDPRATYGDAGSLEATFTLGATTYRVELDKPGFPPSANLPAPPAQSIAGGVVMNQELHGGAALGAPGMTRVHAAAALWGVGRLWRNGQLLTDKAFIHAAALDRGAHADDDTFRVLPVARAGDAELNVLVWNLPRQLEPRGFIQFDFDDVAIAINGLDQPVVAAVPSAGAFVGVAPPSAPVPEGTFLGGVATGNTGTNTGNTGTGGSGLATSGQGATVDQQRLAADAFQTPERVTTANANSIPTDVAAASTNSSRIADSFQNTGRVTTFGSSTGPNDTVAVTVPENFQNNQRVAISNERAPATLNTFAPIGSVTPSTQGSFSITPLAPEVANPGFVFGGERVSADVVATPGTLTSRSAAVPLVATPQPLNAQPTAPFVSTPQPFNSAPAVPLISTPQPLGAQPLSATPPGAVAPGATGF